MTVLVFFVNGHKTLMMMRMMRMMMMMMMMC